MPKVETNLPINGQKAENENAGYTAVWAKYSVANMVAATEYPIAGEPVWLYHDGTDLVFTNSVAKGPGLANGLVAGTGEIGVVISAGTVEDDGKNFLIAVKGKVPLRIVGTGAAITARDYYRLMAGSSVSNASHFVGGTAATATYGWRCADAEATPATPTTNSFAYAVASAASAATNATQTITVYLLGGLGNTKTVA